MKDNLEPAAILAAFNRPDGARILVPYEVAMHFGIKQQDHPLRYKELQERLRLMARAGWLAETVDDKGVARYMAAYSMQLAVPPGLVEAIEKIANPMLVRVGEATIPAGSPVGVDSQGNLCALRGPDHVDRERELLARLGAAVDERCTCGGLAHGECCDACAIWHAVMDGR